MTASADLAKEVYEAEGMGVDEAANRFHQREVQVWVEL